MPTHECKHPAGLVLPGATEKLAFGAKADLTKVQTENPAVQGWVAGGLLVPVKTGK
jgi:hypothetical protein